MSGRGKAAAILLSLFMVASISVSACCPAEAADLIVVEIDFSDSTPNVGETVHVSITFQNQGDAASRVCYWSFDPITTGDIDGVLPSLEPGESHTVDHSFACVDDGTFTTVARVDTQGEVEESNDSNNADTRSLTVGQAANLPDLRVTDIRFIPDPVPLDQDFRIEVDIINDGPVDAGFFHVEWTSPGAVVSSGWDVQSLGAGQSDTLVDVDIPCQVQHSGLSTAEVDDQGHITESDETNNTRAKNFNCGAVATLPDLRVTDIRFIPDPVSLDQDFRIEVDIINDGPVDAGFFHVEWTSPGAVVSSGWDVQSLGAGQPDTLVDVDIPCQVPHSGLSTAEVDDQGHVTESDETNNTRAENFNCVQEVAGNNPPIIDSLSANPLTIEPGETTDLTCTAHDPDPGDSVTSYSWSYSCSNTLVPTCGDFSEMGSTATWQAPNFETVATFWVTVQDENGAIATDSVTVDVIEPEPGNNDPIIDSLTPDQWTVEFGDTVSLDCVAHDPDGDAIVDYYWFVSSTTGGVLWYGCFGTWTDDEGSDATWQAPNIGECASGTIRINVRVEDEHGAQATDHVDIDVVEPEPGNNPPIIDSLSASPLTIAPGETTSLTCTAHDPDPGDSITSYTWGYECSNTIVPTCGDFSEMGSTATWQAPNSETIATFWVTVEDENGAIATDSVIVHVEEPEPVTIERCSIADEDGFVTPDGMRSDTEYIYIGDDPFDEDIQGFFSFDISDIPEGATIVEAWLDLTDFDRIEGDPFTPTTLGRMRAYNHQYGELDVSDYVDGYPTGAIQTFVSPPDYEFDVISEVQDRVDDGQDRFQIRLQFQFDTDSDQSADILIYQEDEDVPCLTIIYITP